MYQLHMTRRERNIHWLVRALASGKSAAMIISNPAPSDRVSFIHLPSAYSKSLDPPKVIIKFSAQILK